LNIEIAPKALASIRSRGGRLFLWTKDIGRGWETDQQAFAPPSDVRFELHEQGEFQLYLEEGIELPEQLEINRRRWPFRGVKVSWDGRPWGARGDWGTREPSAAGPR
jgi:hypothetical protein